MSCSPKEKYDWDLHLPKMKHLYEMNLSITEITNKIQDVETGFTPKQRMVYRKFGKIGYPTDPIERAEFLKTLDLSRQSDIGGSGSTSSEQPVDSINENYNFISHPSPNSTVMPIAHQTSIDYSIPISSNMNDPPNSDFPSETGHSFDTFTSQNNGEIPDAPSGHAFDATSSNSHYWTAKLAQRQSSYVDQSTYQEMTESPIVAQNATTEPTSFDNQGWANNGTSSGYDLQLQGSLSWEQHGLADYQEYDSSSAIRPQSTPQLPLLVEENVEVWGDGLGGISATPQRPLNTADAQLQGISATMLIQSNRDTSAPVGAHEISIATRAESTEINPHIHRIRNGNSGNRGSRNTPSPIDNSSSGVRLLKQLFNRSSTSEKRDSGYASGRNSPLTPVVEDTQPHALSSHEFKKLHRVPCHRLHEPSAIDPKWAPEAKTMERFKETPTCSQCLYSSIHNLSWSASARYLKLGVFNAELKLNTKYNVTALDKAGNSALHYAAAGGASFEHFSTLIRAGVNPYQINTAGQLFLHCLRPHLRKIGFRDLDGNLIAVFHADLVNLLNTFQPKGAFRWRDNEGRTVLDALASNIKDIELRTQTFRHIQDAGYPLEVSSQFPMRKSSKTQSDSRSPLDGEFAVTQQRQQKAWDILGRASVEPSYIDPDTGDNVLHALARLKLDKSGVLLSKIQKFVKKEIDLNLPNQDRDSPLASFISERPFLGKYEDETGATMSKYLDALLWKDARHRIPNRINVNMRNHEGATALYYAAIRARADSVRSLIEAGANVNARLGVDGRGISILQATINAKAQAVLDKDDVKIDHFENVISYLELANAVVEPSLYDERAGFEYSVRKMPCRATTG